MGHQLLENLGIVFLLGIFSQWIAWRMRIPVIVLLTSLGILAGPVFGILQPERVFGDLLHPFIELGVALILFEGGLLLKFQEFKKRPKGMMRLFSLGVVLNWFMGAVAAHYIAGISWQVSLLIAGILIVTGPTVILPALREAKLKTSVSTYLKWEGIVNDPIGVIIAVLVYEYIVFSGSMSGAQFIALSILKIIIISFVLSFSVSYLISWLSKRALLPEFLKQPIIISFIFILFILSEHFQKGSGLLTITLFGILLGNSHYASLKELKNFGESISIFTVSTVFIILSASLDLKVWYGLDWRHYLLIFMLAFVIRPIGIFVATIKSNMRLRERVLIGLYGPRGIVAASVAGAIGGGLYELGYDEAKYILPVIFSVILLTVIIHSFWLNFLAEKLDLKNYGEHGVLIVGANQWSVQLAEKLHDLGLPVMITDSSWYKLTVARMKGIETYFGYILNDLEYGEPDISRFDYLITTSEDDSYNSLVCHKLKHVFGAEHVYQIPKHVDDFSQQHGLTIKDYYTLDDSENALFENMLKRFHFGWTFRSTELKDTYTYEQFKEDNPRGKTVPLLILRANQRV
ncbi:MAG: sodium:proton antiporter, partial [Halobacteriovoraceae bacterium]|nr:sodium:proton antiporter [Halobacteriovoraceae bacterium]